MNRLPSSKSFKLSAAIIFGVTAYLTRNIVKQPLRFIMSDNPPFVNHPPVQGSWRGVLGSPEFPVEPDRYHLYAAWFCPFAGRVLLTREMKGLQDYLPMDIVRPYPKVGILGVRFVQAADEFRNRSRDTCHATWGARAPLEVASFLIMIRPWRFPATNDEYPGATVDRLFHSEALSEIYHKNEPDRKDKFSVPLLWDKKTNQIVNNESEDIMRMLNTAFNDYLPSNSAEHTLDFYPPDLRPQIDEINSWLMPNLNNGVYRAGFAPNQESYEPACRTVFETLARVSDILSSHNKLYLLGSRMTEVDLKLYCTLIRFDAIYVQHFKLNIGTIRHDFPILHRYLKHLYWKIGGFKEVTDFKHIKENYSKSHGDINPKHITPLGPLPDMEPWTEDDEAWLRSQDTARL